MAAAVPPGLYDEAVDVHKSLTLDGAGSGNNPAVDTIVRHGSPGRSGGGGIVMVSASNVTVKDLRADLTSAVSGGHDSAISVGYRNGPLSTTISDTLLENVVGTSVGNGFTTFYVVDDLDLVNSSFTVSGSYGGRVMNAANDILISGSHFDNNASQGLDFSPNSATGTGAVTNLQITGSTFNDNGANALQIKFASGIHHRCRRGRLEREPGRYNRDPAALAAGRGAVRPDDRDVHLGVGGFHQQGHQAGPCHGVQGLKGLEHGCGDLSAPGREVIRGGRGRRACLGERVARRGSGRDSRDDGTVVRAGGVIGRKNIRTDEPTEKVDTKVLGTLIELGPDVRLPVGLRVDAFIRRER